jgi:hypothetical protein
MLNKKRKETIDEMYTCERKYENCFFFPYKELLNQLLASILVGESKPISIYTVTPKELINYLLEFKPEGLWFNRHDVMEHDLTIDSEKIKKIILEK